MASYSETVTYNTIRALTLPKVAKKIADNITAKIPAFYFLDKIGHKEYESGGDNYQFPIFQELATGQAYTGLTALDNDELDPVTIASFSRKQLTQPIVLSGTKLLQNSGNDETAVVNYIKAQVEMSLEGLKDTIAGSGLGLMSDEADGDLGITGFGTMLPTSTTTGTYGKLDRATYTAWRHKSDSITTGMNTDGVASMLTLLVAVSRGDETPTVIFITPTGWANFARVITGTVSYNTPSPATAFGDIGFKHIMFYGAPILADDKVPANTGYFLNLKYVKLIVHKDRDFSIRDFISTSTQDALFGRIYWAGNLVCNNLARQGLLTGSVDTY